MSEQVPRSPEVEQPPSEVTTGEIVAASYMGHDGQEVDYGYRLILRHDPNNGYSVIKVVYSDNGELVPQGVHSSISPDTRIKKIPVVDGSSGKDIRPETLLDLDRFVALLEKIATTESFFYGASSFDIDDKGNISCRDESGELIQGLTVELQSFLNDFKAAQEKRVKAEKPAETPESPEN